MIEHNVEETQNNYKINKSISDVPSKMINQYECLRCKYITHKLQNIKYHLNKKNKCEKINTESIPYTDEEIYELSTIRLNKRNDVKCEFCNKPYSDKKSLYNHQKNYCKEKTNQDITNNINIDNINITNNITNIININLPVSFDNEWNLEHFDNYLKIQSIICKNKFTGFLNSILKNKINLNVVLDKNMKEARIFNGDKYENIAIKELSEKSMEKIYNQLTKLKEELKYEDGLEISFDEDIRMIEKKYQEYKKSSEIKKKVEEHIASIYDTKKIEAYEIYEDFNNHNKIENSYTDY